MKIFVIAVVMTALCFLAADAMAQCSGPGCPQSWDSSRGTIYNSGYGGPRVVGSWGLNQSGGCWGTQNRTHTYSQFAYHSPQQTRTFVYKQSRPVVESVIVTEELVYDGPVMQYSQGATTRTILSELARRQALRREAIRNYRAKVKGCN